MSSRRLFRYGGVLCVRVGDLVKYKNGVVNFSGIVTEVLNPYKVNVCFYCDKSLYTNVCEIRDLIILSSIRGEERETKL